MEQRWIPVDERLPENNVKVWLSFTNQYTSYVKNAFWNGNYFEHTNGKKVKNNPTAWKEYNPPEPYRDGEQPKWSNADRIRSMTNEELAAFCCKVKADYQWADHEFPDEDACGDWEEWLRAESEGI